MRLTSSRLKETSVRVLFCTIISDNVISSEVEGSRDETYKVHAAGISRFCPGRSIFFPKAPNEAENLFDANGPHC